MLDNIYETIEKDELYLSLTAPDALANRSANAGRPAKRGAASSSSSSALSIADQIKQLSLGLDRVTSELQSQVRQQHGALLQQASHAGQLSVALDAVSGHQNRLQAGADRLRSQIHAPFARVQHQTHVLARLHDASHLLRGAARFLQLTRQLQAAAGRKDAAAQALVLHELEPLAADTQLAAVELIREERALVLAARQRLNTKCNHDLLQALRTGNEPLAARSLLVFANLQQLDVCVANLLDTFHNEVRQAIQECFAGTAVTLSATSTTATATSTKAGGPRKSAGGAMPADGAKRAPGRTPTLVTSQHFRTKLWQSIVWLFDDEIHGCCAQVVLLQQCLAAAPGGGGGLLAANTAVTTADIEQRFWQRLEQLLQQSFGECPIHVRQCLQQDLPKLLTAARSLQARFGTKFTFAATVFQPLEAGYLEQCAVQLKAPLLGCDQPAADTVDELVRVAGAELGGASGDERLTLLVANVFNACGGELVSRISGQVKLGTDSKQVIDIPNAAQLQNIQLANTLHYYDVQVQRMVQQLGAQFAAGAAAEIVLKDLQKSRRLVATIVQQLFESMQTAINIILLSMHREPGLSAQPPLSASKGTAATTTTTQSLYMKELQEFVQRSWTLHIVPFADRATVASCGRQLAERCIELFIHNVIVLRPISTVGRQKLCADAQHLETALRPIGEDISAFGRPYRQLRAVASLITMSAAELAAQPIQLDGPIAPFAVLLLQFGHAGPEMLSPHTAAGWSADRLLEWLAGHTADRERLELISGALQKYRTTTRQRNCAQYDPVYPGIVAYFEAVSKAMAEAAK